MIRFLIKTNPEMNNSYNKLYSNAVLNSFKAEVLKIVNYSKIQIRYDYLLENEIMQYKETDDIIEVKHLINLLLGHFKIQTVVTNNNEYSTAICLYDYIIIPNSNMSYTHFLRFIQYGNEDIGSYPFINTAWRNIQEREASLHK